METELGNDAVNGSFADREVTLSEFLSDDFSAGVRIQEAVTDDLTDQFLGAPVVGFGTSFGTEESLAAFFEKEGAELEVTLAAETKLGGGAIDAIRAALAVYEHGEFTSDLVILGNGQRAEFTLDAFAEKCESDHRGPPG